MLGQTLGQPIQTQSQEGLPDAVERIESFDDWVAMELRSRAGWGQPADVLTAGSPGRAALEACALAVRGHSPNEVEQIAYMLRAFAHAAARIPQG